MQNIHVFVNNQTYANILNDKKSVKNAKSETLSQNIHRSIYYCIFEKKYVKERNAPGDKKSNEKRERRKNGENRSDAIQRIIPEADIISELISTQAGACFDRFLRLKINKWLRGKIYRSNEINVNYFHVIFSASN